jgi:hypothetical protein
MNKIALNMDGVSVVMEDIRYDSAARSMICSFVVSFDALSVAQMPSRECLFLFSDLKRMASYVRKHVGENAPHDIEESATFVTYDLGFQLQALSGELENWNDGCFTMRWMFIAAQKIGRVQRSMSVSKRG